MSLETLATMLFFAVYGGLLLWNVARPGRVFPEMRGWHLKGVIFLAAYFAISSFLPLLWVEWFAAHRLIDATGLGVVGGAVVGFLAVELGIYAWHRALHRVPFLWRWFHQMHHSAERIDVTGAYYSHPLDVAGFTLVGSVFLVLVIGVRAEAALIVGVATNFLTVLQHANIRTPHWMGYLIIRPEAHTLHHERGVHAYNYADIPLFDVIFGTYRNPRVWEGQAGFSDGASERVLEMLVGKDISTEEPAPAGADTGDGPAVVEPTRRAA